MLHGTVLIVDDAPAILAALRMALTTLGVKDRDILAASSAEEARQLVAAHEPALIFMDIALGEDRGDELTMDLLHEDPKRRIVMITGLDRRDQRVRDAVSAGAYDVIEKPIRLTRVRELLDLVAAETRGLRRVG